MARFRGEQGDSGVLSRMNISSDWEHWNVRVNALLHTHMAIFRSAQQIAHMVALQEQVSRVFPLSQ